MASDASPPLPFLSDEWLAAAVALVDGAAGSALDQPGLVVNATITSVPFGVDTLRLHTTHGPVVGWSEGHAETPAFSVTTDYYTARAIVLDPSATFDALSQGIAVGNVTFDGDVAQLAAWWGRRVGDATAADLEAKLRAITR